MAVPHRQRLTDVEYRDLALKEPDHAWELWDGVPREKPPTSMTRDDVATFLGDVLRSQLDRRDDRVHVNLAKLRVAAGRIFIPDVAVIPARLLVPHWGDPRTLNAYADPLPFVAEIWNLHPDDRTLFARRRQPAGTYADTIHSGGAIPGAALPGVAVDLAALFAG